MKLGIDQIQKFFQKLSGKKIGILCHGASVNSKYQHLLKLLEETKRGPILSALFGPEHGLWGVAQDMEAVADCTLPSPVSSPQGGGKSVPIHSLYGNELKSLQPKFEWMEGLDAVICDLQDVGARYYTFVYTIAFVMKACAAKGIPLYVLDRPNPLGGETVEGNLIEAGFESFVGAFPITNRHGMTVGELCQMFNREDPVLRGNDKAADLRIVRLKDWKRKHYLDDTDAAWVLPSPNMPTLDTALVYPGMCLIEATEISEGRGTTKPFEIFGAPFIDPQKLKNYLDQKFKLPGVFFRPLYFKPTFQKHAHEVCGGLQLHVTHRKKFRPYLTGLAIVKALQDLYPKDFQWREKPYEFVKDIPAIDLLTGSAQFRLALEKGKSWKDILGFYEKGKEKFLKQRKEYLLY
ncbi:MAG: DUF1343 domain-containing protein [Deltaproteobacteria bacterium]|nr:DUF1343 domain-containing protein [Deltaproteobacteria bacterium]